MKKVKGKYIRLTETDLKKIILETVDRLILEYALHRKEFLKACKSRFKQIIENYCLVRYCSINNVDLNDCKNHWKNELYSHISFLSNIKLKENNTYDYRLKTINIALNDLDLTSPQEIFSNVDAKFKTEGISFSDPSIQEVCQDCFDSLKNISHVIATNDITTRNEFVESL